MRRNIQALLGTGLAVLCLAVLASPHPARADRDEADQLIDRYVAAYNRGDAAALAALYADDAWLLPHERPMVHGRRDIQEFWRRRLSGDHLRQMGRMLEVKTLERNVGADVGYLIGSFIRRDGPTGLNFAIGVKRGDHGEWRIAAEVWNSTELSPRYQPAS